MQPTATNTEHRRVFPLSPSLFSLPFSNLISFTGLREQELTTARKRASVPLALGQAHAAAGMTSPRAQVSVLALGMLSKRP